MVDKLGKGDIKMSNEYRDWIEDLRNSPKDSEDYDRYIALQYPWARIHTWEGKVLDGDEDTSIFYYRLPDGWKIAFLEPLLKELDAAIKKLPPAQQEEFYLLDVKEKYGSLRIYPIWYTNEIDKVIDKYSEISERTCYDCGAPATKISTGWIEPYCDEHAPPNSTNINEDPLI